MSFVDVHSHLVPGVDDGAQDIAQALEAIDQLVAAGARALLTTPHVDASVIVRPETFERSQRRVEMAWRTVVEACRERHPRVDLHLGREIMLDTPTPDLRDPRVRLNDGPYVLVEYPRLAVPPSSEDVLLYIADQGCHPLIAHVERYNFMEDEWPILAEWREAGGRFQVNAASLLGKYGPEAEDRAWRLMRSGWVDVVASDYHGRGNPCLVEGRTALAERGGQEQAILLFDVNPGRVIAGEALEQVPPLPRKPDRVARLVNRFRRSRGG